MNTGEKGSAVISLLTFVPAALSGVVMFGAMLLKRSPAKSHRTAVLLSC